VCVCVCVCVCVTAMRGHTEKEALQEIAFRALAAITWSSMEIQASAREAGAVRWRSRRVGVVGAGEAVGRVMLVSASMSVTSYTCWLYRFIGCTQHAHAHAHAHTHVHTHPRKHTQMHAHALTRTHKHRQVQLCMKTFETNSTIQQQGNIILKKLELAGS
jgi:hypothetical protein